MNIHGNKALKEWREQLVTLCKFVDFSGKESYEIEKCGISKDFCVLSFVGVEKFFTR